MSLLETDYQETLKETSPESADSERNLERVQAAKPSEQTAALSPESKAAMQQRIQGIEQADQQEAPERQIIGTPEQDARYLHRQTGETCATVAQEGIIEKHSGVDYGEGALAQEALEQGWTDEDGGTSPECVGNLLENHDIPTQRWLDGSADLDTLKNELAQGNDVIVGVDAGDFYQDPALINSGGHAVWVTGLEVDTDGDISNVIVNDSNAPEPQVHDVQTFQNAWDGADRLMVATRQNAPET